MEETNTDTDTSASAVIITDDVWVVASAKWINEYVRNSPLAQSVGAWNHLGIILPEFRRCLEEALNSKGDEPKASLLNRKGD